MMRFILSGQQTTCTEVLIKLYRLPSAPIFPIFSYFFQASYIFLYFEQISYIFLYFWKNAHNQPWKSCFHRNLQHLTMSFWGPSGPQTLAGIRSLIFVLQHSMIFHTWGSLKGFLICILKALRCWAFALLFKSVYFN